MIVVGSRHLTEVRAALSALDLMLRDPKMDPGIKADGSWFLDKLLAYELTLALSLSVKDTSK